MPITRSKAKSNHLRVHDDELVKMMVLLAPNSEFSKTSANLVGDGKRCLKNLTYVVQKAFKATHGNWVNGNEEKTTRIRDVLVPKRRKNVGSDKAVLGQTVDTRKTFTVEKLALESLGTELPGDTNTAAESVRGKPNDNHNYAFSHLKESEVEGSHRKRWTSAWAKEGAFLDGQLYLINPLLLDTAILDPATGKDIFQIFPTCENNFKLQVARVSERKTN